MALDAAMIYVCARSLNERLSGARVDKLYMPTRDEAVLSLRTADGTAKLLISARSGSARVHMTREELENPATPPGFCMLLRKHLNNARITGVCCPDGERMLFIGFEATNEMGDRVSLKMSVELMGRYSNIVLVNADNKVIDALKRIDDDISDKRTLMPGISFTMPPTQDKLPFLSTDSSTLANAVLAQSKPLSSALLSVISGIGPVVCREIAWRTDKSDPCADTLTADARAALENNIETVRRAANGEGMCLNVVYDGARPIEYSFIALTQYTGCERREFEDIDELLDGFYALKDRAERAKARSHDLLRQVGGLLDRAVRKQQARREELEDSAKAEQKRLFGELVQANLHSLERGMKSAELLNYYTAETVSVPLDPTKNPVQNSQKYYKDYKKLTTAAKMLAKLIAEGDAEIEYLSSVKYEISEAKTEEDFLLIRKELKDAGYLRGFKFDARKKLRKTSEFIEYRTSGGLKVLVGRNNAANEKLTLRTADKSDVWFHVKNAAGSHTVLLCEGVQPDEQSLTQAALIAALHSSQSAGENVAVDYTTIKNVRKAQGTKTGMVIYERYKTAFVTPDEKQAQQLKVK